MKPHRTSSNRSLEPGLNMSKVEPSPGENHLAHPALAVLVAYGPIGSSVLFSWVV